MGARFVVAFSVFITVIQYFYGIGRSGRHSFIKKTSNLQVASCNNVVVVER